MNIHTKVMGVSVASLIGMGIALPVNAQATCNVYTRDTSVSMRGRVEYEEVNNCPLARGTYSNADWEVFVSAWEPGLYIFKGKNKKTGASVQVYDLDVRGTTSRPQYYFNNKEVSYVVTFQPADPGVIRLEVLRGRRHLLNQLLYQ